MRILGIIAVLLLGVSACSTKEAVVESPYESGWGKCRPVLNQDLYGPPSLCELIQPGAIGCTNPDSPREYAALYFSDASRFILQDWLEKVKESGDCQIAPGGMVVEVGEVLGVGDFRRDNSTVEMTRVKIETMLDGEFFDIIYMHKVREGQGI